MPTFADVISLPLSSADVGHSSPIILHVGHESTAFGYAVIIFGHLTLRVPFVSPYHSMFLSLFLYCLSSLLPTVHLDMDTLARIYTSLLRHVFPSV